MISQDRITIIEPNGVERTRPLTGRGFTIGRGNDNDLVLNYDLISRYHVRITYEGGHYYVTDLNSANGTYLANTRLEPNAPTLWNPGRRLRAGEVIIQLEQVTQPHSPVGVDPGETVVGQLTREQLNQPNSQQRRMTGLAWAIIVLLLLCVLAASATGIYYYYF